MNRKSCLVSCFFYLLVLLVSIINSNEVLASCISDVIVAECNNGICTEGFKEMRSGETVNATDRDLEVIAKAVFSYDGNTNTSGVFSYGDIDEKLCDLQSIPGKLGLDTLEDAKEIAEMVAMLPAKSTIIFFEIGMSVIMAPIFLVLLIVIRRGGVKPNFKVAYGIIGALVLMLFVMFFLPPSSHRYMCISPPHITIAECHNNKCFEGFKVSEGHFFCEYTDIEKATKEEFSAIENNVRKKYNNISGIYENIVDLPIRYRFTKDKSQHENQISFQKLEVKTLEKAKERWKNNIRNMFFFEYIFSVVKAIISVVAPFLLVILFIIWHQLSKEKTASEWRQQAKAAKILLFVLLYGATLAMILGPFLIILLPFFILFICVITITLWDSGRIVFCKRL